MTLHEITAHNILGAIPTAAPRWSGQHRSLNGSTGPVALPEKKNRDLETIGLCWEKKNQDLRERSGTMKISMSIRLKEIKTSLQLNFGLGV
jgi:hypothetical protein